MIVETKQSFILIRSLEVKLPLVAAIGNTFREMHMKHGMAGTRLYKIWKGMRRRCSDNPLIIIITEIEELEFVKNGMISWFFTNGR